MENSHKSLLDTQILKNAIARIIVYVLAVIIQIMMVPYILKNIGTEEYGILGVINSFLSYAAILTVSLSSSIGKNLIFFIEKKEYNKASIEISTVSTGIIAFSSIFVPLMLMLTKYVPSLLNVPKHIFAEVQFITVISIICFLLNVFCGIINSATFVRDRLDIAGYIELLQKIILFTSTVISFYFFKNGLIQYGYALVFSNLVILFLRLYIFKKLLPNIKISFKQFSWGRLKDNLFLNFWLVINQVGALLFLQTDLIVANQILSGEVAGQFAAILIIPIQIRVLATLAANLFGPTHTKLLANNETKKFQESLGLSIKVTGLFTALLVGIFCGFAEPILTFWLGTDFSHLSFPAIMLTIYLAPVLSIMPCWTVLLALNENKPSALVTLLMGVLHVITCIIITPHFGILGIISSSLFYMTIRNLIIVPTILYKKNVVSLKDFYLNVINVILVCIVIFIISLLIKNSIKLDSAMDLFYSLSLSSVVSITIILFILKPLSPYQKNHD